MKPMKEGKVREVYDLGDRVIMVATDRISAFDVILKNRIDNKGRVLTQMSRFWFEMTESIVKNHMISVDIADMPQDFQTPEYKGRAMLCKKLEMLPIECIVRGYITGSGWQSYQENGKVCGITLPDENISFERSVEILEEAYPNKGAEYAGKIRDYTLQLYNKCADYARTRGIIIADTKFEFGLDENGDVVLADEMLTPDSSRFWPLEGYKPGQSQPSFDKQYVRDWLKAHPDSDAHLPDDVIQKTIEKYMEAYELLTGKKLED